VIEGNGTGEDLVEDDPQRVDIRARVDLLPSGLLWRDVLGRPEDDAGTRDGARRAGDLRDAEVEHLHEVGMARPRQDEDVVGLHVTMDDARAVRRAERRG